MRITTGIYKGRVLKMPKGIRPTQHMVRKAVFDILGDIRGLTFLELYAGSGAVGLEAASRGASAVVLVESNGECVRVIRQNIAELGFQNSFVYLQDVSKSLDLMGKSGKIFDIIFLDPPYHKENTEAPSLAKKTLQILGGSVIVSPDGLVVAQHFKKDVLPDSEGFLSLRRQSRYGDAVLSFYGVS